MNRTIQLGDVARNKLTMPDSYLSEDLTDAPYAKCMEKVLDLQMKINDEIDRLIDLKDQMRAAIAKVSDVDEQMVLRYRYIQNKTWEQIGDELHADRATVYRWHNQALRHVRLPEKPIKI